MFVNGCLIDYNCVKQGGVATSSTEAEYVAVSEACKFAIYLFMMLSEWFQVIFPMPVMVDNQGAIFANLYRPLKTKEFKKIKKIAVLKSSRQARSNETTKRLLTFPVNCGFSLW